MSWSPDVFIGELRPWPDTVHVVRGKTDEMRRYVSESECDQLRAENAKLRELVWRLLEVERIGATSSDWREIREQACELGVEL